MCTGPQNCGPKTVRELRDLYWAIKSKVFSSTPLLLKKSDDKSKELESTLKEWLGDDVVMERTSKCVTTSSLKATPKYVQTATGKSQLYISYEHYSSPLTTFFCMCTISLQALVYLYIHYLVLYRLLISAVSKKTNVELHFFNNCFSDEYTGG